MIKGIRFSGIASGIKATGLDLGLVSFDEAAPYSALYTANKVKAAHILYNERRAGRKARALLANSGCANACTGEDGIEDLAIIAHELAALLRIREEEVLFASTGVIGKRLPVGAVVEGLPALVARLGGERIEDFARAVMTTDTYPKIAGAQIPGAEGWSVEGVAKGAGMINPLFATMLAFVFTDCPLDPLRMGRLLPALGRETFERISVDGDTSTNDTVMLFSTVREGAKAGIDPIREALGRVMKELALMIVKDGEGATKVIHLTVKGASKKRLAEAIARRIAGSPLVKTAFFGCDPNWGRIICAAGDALVPLDPEKVEIALQGERLAVGGVEAPFSEEKIKGLMAGRELELVVDLHDGASSYDMYTTDLTYDYIRINASYRT